MKTKYFTINVLGTVYDVLPRKRKQDKALESNDGYTDFTTKTIVVLAEAEGDIDDVSDFDFLQKRILRHEIIHAFMYESGLGSNFEHKGFGQEETMVDWFAIQFPKIEKVFKDNDLI